MSQDPFASPSKISNLEQSAIQSNHSFGGRMDPLRSVILHIHKDTTRMNDEKIKINVYGGIATFGIELFHDHVCMCAGLLVEISATYLRFRTSF